MMMMMISMANNIVTGPSDLLIITYILLLYDVLLWKGLSIILELKLCNQFSEYGSSTNINLPTLMIKSKKAIDLKKCAQTWVNKRRKFSGLHVT